MLHLLAKASSAGDKRQSAEGKRHEQTTDAEDAAEPSDASSTSSTLSAPRRFLSVPSPSSSSDVPSGSSPLAFVSSLQTLLHSAKHSLKEVKAGVRAGISNIEAAAHRAQEEHEAEQRAREAAEAESEEEKEQGEEEDEWKSQPAASSRRGARWHKRNNRSDGEDEEDDDHDSSSPSAASSSSGSSLSAEDLSIRRINFLRLLNRCEAASFRHLHAGPGEKPLLQVRPGEHNSEAQAFFRSVALLQRELAEYFTPPPQGSRSSHASSHHRYLHADPNKDVELRRRVGFLATVSEKESAAMGAASSVNAAPLLRPVQPWTPSASAYRGAEEDEKKGDRFAAPVRRRPGSSGVAARAANAASSFAAAGSSSFATRAAPSHTKLAPGVHSLRSTSVASLSSGASASAASSSSARDGSPDDDADSAAASSPTAFAGFSDADLSSPLALVEDETVAELLERAPPPLDPAQEVRAQLFARSAAYAGGSGASGSSGSSGPSAEFRAELEQRALLSELHGMTESLKENALRLRSAMQADARVLEQSDELLDRSIAAIGVENSRLKQWASGGCSEMCWNILLIVVLWVVFIATYIFIKIFPAPKS